MPPSWPGSCLSPELPESGPTASSELARLRMQRQARRDTAPELALRRELWRRGVRYRVDLAPVPGMRRRADLVFTKARVAVFVDGCFWHRCPIHGTSPKANRDWWMEKLDANVRRDRDTERRLDKEGWRVVRVWEHESTKDAADRIEAIVR
jgi:DNA mismatch endonuclease (patch repair protein)